MKTKNTKRIVSTADFGVLADSLATKGVALRFEARGRSMAPAIRDGDILTVTPIRGIRARVGDVVLYRTPRGSALAHRVIGRTRRAGFPCLVCLGDAVMGPREIVPLDRVLGRITCLKRGHRTIETQSAVARGRGIVTATARRMRIRVAQRIRRKESSAH